MNEVEYEEWSRYYDVTDRKEFKAINQCMSASDLSDVWQNKSVLEIGCGSGRFTNNYVELASKVVALDPDTERVALLKDKIVKRHLTGKCTAIDGDILELVSHPDHRQHFEEQFDIVIFTWSWAYIEKKEETLKVALSKLKSDGILIVTMVVDGEFENFVLETNLATAKDVNDVPNDLKRNRDSMYLLRSLLTEADYKLTENEVTTDFSFDTVDIASKMITPLLLNINQESLLPMLNKYRQIDGTILMTDTVLCVCGELNK